MPRIELKGTVLLSCLLLFFLFPSCSLLEKKDVPEDDNSLNSTDKIIAESFETYDACTVNISIEKLEFEMASFEKEFVFQGSVIPKDTGADFEKIKNSFTVQKENGNLFSPIPAVLELHFSDAIPKSVTWYGIYINNGNIAYPGLSIPMPLDNVDVKTILPIGMNLAAPLDSNSTSKEYYRIIRIVCEYGDQTVEYNVFLIANVE